MIYGYTQRMFDLGKYLIKKGRLDDWERASEDKDFLQELFEELEEQASSLV